MVATVEIKPTYLCKISALNQTLLTKQANVSSNEKRVYLGVSETPFKQIYSNYERDGKHERCSNATKLSKYVWELKRNKKAPITCKAARKVYGNPKHIFCRIMFNREVIDN